MDDLETASKRLVEIAVNNNSDDNNNNLFAVQCKYKLFYLTLHNDN